jgi:hypothetical protein
MQAGQSGAPVPQDGSVCGVARQEPSDDACKAQLVRPRLLMLLLATLLQQLAVWLA